MRWSYRQLEVLSPELWQREALHEFGGCNDRELPAQCMMLRVQLLQENIGESGCGDLEAFAPGADFIVLTKAAP